MRIIPGKTMTDTIIEWNEQRGFGFLKSGEARIFLHRREFAAIHKRAEIGDAISFSIGTDAKGRPCATRAAHVNDGGKLTVGALFILALLLVAPIFASLRRGIEPTWLCAFMLLIGAITYLMYSDDKRRAKVNRWRIPEAQLHLFELLGGWPAAFLAQRKLRHKVSKASYQIVFWTIILAYQFASIDSLLNWKLTHMAMDRLEARLNKGGSSELKSK